MDVDIKLWSMKNFEIFEATCPNSEGRMDGSIMYIQHDELIIGHPFRAGFICFYNLLIRKVAFWLNISQFDMMPIGLILRSPNIVQNLLQVILYVERYLIKQFCLNNFPTFAGNIFYIFILFYVFIFILFKFYLGVFFLSFVVVFDFTAAVIFIFYKKLYFYLINICSFTLTFLLFRL